MLLDVIWLLNFNFAPFKSEAWYGHVTAGLADYVKTASEDDELFVHLYQRICEDHGDSDGRVGSEEHYRETFRGLQVDTHLNSLGEKVKWNRWSSVVYTFEKLACAMLL